MGEGEVRLRRLEMEDLGVLYEHQCDPASIRLAGVLPRDRESYEAHFAEVLDDPRVAARTVLLDGVVVGVISCFERDGERCVGYWIDRAHWGRGIATRSLELLLEEVRERPLVAHVAAHNGASLRVLARCGFVETGRRMSPGTERYVACEEVVMELA